VKHAARSPRYLPLLRHLGRPLGAMVERHGLSGFTPLRTYLDAVCQITVQCSAAEAEACFALSALDYFWRGTGHVRGGIGVLARGLCDALTGLGAEVRLGDRVKGLRREGALWRLETRRGPLLARAVVANVLPGDLQALLGTGDGSEGLAALDARVQDGWGAVMLYRVLRPPAGAGPGAHHLQLVADAALPLQEGNHVFASLSAEDEEGRAPAGLRTQTVSTHVPLSRLRTLDGAGQGAYVAEVQERMRRTLALRAPDWCGGLVHELTASPRTFARFTRRAHGAVGGVPRRAGLGNYAQLGPLEAARGLWLAGDSVFPGQSTYATAIGGVRTAEAIARAS